MVVKSRAYPIEKAVVLSKPIELVSMEDEIPLSIHSNVNGSFD